MRFQTPLDQTGLVDVAPLYGNLGIAEPRRILPSKPQQSTLLARMRTLSSDRMPPLASLRVDSQGTALIERWIAEWAATAVSPSQTAPDHFSLQQNYPKPLNANTLIRYALSGVGQFSIVIYYVLVQQVRTLAKGKGAAGTRAARRDGLHDRGTPAASGLYFYRLQQSGRAQTRRMTLLR